MTKGVSLWKLTVHYRYIVSLETVSNTNMFIKLLVNGLVEGKTCGINRGWYKKNMYGHVLSIFHDFPLDQSNDRG